MPDAATITYDTTRLCARGDHCPAAVHAPDGALVPALAPSGCPYCTRCASAVHRTLGAMPWRYAWLRWHIGDKGTAPPGPRVTGTREAPIPLRADIDALIREMVSVLSDWDERVAAAAGLDRPGTELARRRRDEVALPAAAAALRAHLPVLLALPAEPMMRTMPLSRNAPPLPPGTTGWVHQAAGYVRYFADLSGADAGRDIFRLAWLSRRLLGETVPPPERLDGVPCKGCDVLALVACADPEYRSECESCGDILSPGEYLEWVRKYTRIARQWVEDGTVAPADPRGYSRMAA
jgi:hypothetical protein